MLILTCFFADDTSCGIGSQRRMIDCVRSDGKIVHPYHCRVERRRIPMLLRMCTVPCPKNCEISEWGAWSSCQNRCNTVSMQRRIRFILARAANGGQSCLQSEPLQGTCLTILCVFCAFIDGQKKECTEEQEHCFSFKMF